jgi:hypothetical protein
MGKKRGLVEKETRRSRITKKIRKVGGGGVARWVVDVSGGWGGGGG